MAVQEQLAQEQLLDMLFTTADKLERFCEKYAMLKEAKDARTEAVSSWEVAMRNALLVDPVKAEAKINRTKEDTGCAELMRAALGISLDLLIKDIHGTLGNRNPTHKVSGAAFA